MTKLSTPIYRSAVALCSATVLALGLTACSMSIEGDADKSSSSRAANNTDKSASSSQDSTDDGDNDSSENSDTTPIVADRTIQCTGQDVALVNAEESVALTGSCGAVSISAASVSVTAETIDSLTVVGSDVTVVVDTVSSISVLGADNSITWSQGDPTTSDLGADNSIVKG